MLSVPLILYVLALFLVVANAIGKCPGWIPLLLVIVAGLVQTIPTLR